MSKKTPTPPDQQTPSGAQKRGCRPTAVIVLVVLLLLGTGAFAAWVLNQAILAPYQSCIYPNVYVLGENLGGFTEEEAKNHLEQVFATWDAGDLILSDGDRIWRVPWAQAGMQLDAAATAANAFAAGRDQDWRTVVSLWLGALGWGTSRHVAPVFTIDAQATHRALEEIAPELYEAPVDAKVRLEGDQLKTTSAQPGRALAIEATAEKIVNTVTHLGPDYPFAPTYRAVEPRIADVSAVKAAAEEMLNREIHLTARGENEGQTFTWSWTLGRETIARWLRIERTEANPAYAVQVDKAAIGATVEELASEPKAQEWGFPSETVTEQIAAAFEAGGGEVAVELTPPPRIYVVQPGDRLTTIAEKLRMPPGLIAEVNQDVDLDHLHVGQELLIPPQDVLTPYETVPGKRIVISIAEQRLRAYEDDQVLYDWPCSTGKEDSPTYRGDFQVLSKEEMAYASQWDLQMPHFIAVYRAGGDTYNGIHALPILSNGQRLWAGHLGSKASFGCIILGIEEAETLFEWAELGVPVTIE